MLIFDSVGHPWDGWIARRMWVANEDEQVDLVQASIGSSVSSPQDKSQ
jgi:hypothetical protein